MDIFKRLFAKGAPAGIFSVVFPQAPAGLQNREFLKAYKGWVYACVRVIANDVGMIELQLQAKTAKGWVEVQRHESLDVIARTNPFTTTDGLFKGTSSFLDLTGNAFWYVAYNGRGVPAEIWQLDPTKVDVVKSDSNFIQEYIYTNPKGAKIHLKPWEVIPFQEFNPEDPYKGRGPTEAAALSIDTNQYAKEWNRNFFFNSAMPAIALTSEQTVTPEQRDLLLEKWLARFKGVANAHQPVVLGGGLKVEKIGDGAKDMDFANQLTFLRDEILATFGVPKSVLGITEDVNRANAEASEYVFAKRVVMPRNRFIATTLSEFYLPLWGLSPAKYRFIAKDVVPQNVEADLKRKQVSLAGASWRKINEIREEEGLPPVPDGDKLFIPSTLTTTDLTVNPPAPQPLGGPGDKPGEKPPKPAKGVTKGTDDASVGLRITFLHKAIMDAQKDMETILTTMAADVATRLAKVKPPKSVKADDPNATLVTEAALITAVLEGWEEYAAVLTAFVDDTARPVYEFGGTRSIARAGLSVVFDLDNPRAEQWLRDRGLHSATQISDTVKEEIRARLVQGVKDGKGAKEIAADIGEFFDGESQWRALRIARTEVIEAYSQGSLEGARQSNLTEKRWLTAGDDRVEEECMRNQFAGWIPREQAFPTGHVAPVIHPNDRCDVEYRAAA